MNTRQEMLKAKDIAGDPFLYNSLVTIGYGKTVWGCLGYSKAGKVKFARIVQAPGMKVRQINIYVDPETIVWRVQ